MKRILSLVASLGLVALMLGGTASAVFAWTPPTINPICSDTTGQYNWTIVLASGESDYHYQISPDGSTWSASLAGSAGANSQTTGSQVLYVRWAADTSSKTGPVTNNAGRCTPVMPTITVNQCTSVGGTGSITISGLVDGLQVQYDLNLADGGLEGWVKSEDGTYPLSAGSYFYLVEDVDAHVFVGPVDFTIGTCPVPSPSPSPSASPSPSPSPVSPPCTVANNCYFNSPSPAPSTSPAPSPSPLPSVVPSPVPSPSPAAIPPSARPTPPPTSTSGGGEPANPALPISLVLLAVAGLSLFAVRSARTR